MLSIRALIHDSRWRLHWRLLALACVVIVAWFAFMPSDEVPEVTGVDKVNHLLAFVALAFTVRQAGLTWMRAALALLAYGVLIEVVQSFLPTRHGDIADLVADLVGIAAGLLCVTLTRRLVRVR